MPPEGRHVRCLRCQTVWHAEPSHADKLRAAVADIAPDREAAEASAAAAFAHAPASDVDAWEDDPAARPADGSFAGAGDHDGAPSAGEMQESGAGQSFEVESPPTVPADPAAGPASVDIDAEDSSSRKAGPAEDIESFATRRQRRRKAKSSRIWPLSHLQTGMLALFLANVIIIGWRSDIVAALPQTASFYGHIGLPVNLRGLAFDGVVTTIEQHEGVPILLVEGNVINTAHRIVDVPRLKFVVRNAARQEIYSWTAVPSRTMLPPGEAVLFRTRLASPPPDAHDLIVRFVTRRDLVAAAAR